LRWLSSIKKHGGLEIKERKAEWSWEILLAIYSPKVVFISWMNERHPG
jgi:hypothetical protein